MSLRIGALATILLLAAMTPGLGQDAAPTPAPAGALAPQMQQDKARALAEARRAGLEADPTVAGAEERAWRWKAVLLLDPTDVEAQLGYGEAQRDLRAAREKESAELQAAESTARDDRAAAEDRKRRLRAAENALLTRNLAGAESVVNDVLAESPDDPKALSLMASIRAARQAQEVRRRVLFIAGALLALAAGLGVLLKKLQKRKPDTAAQAEAASATPRARALVKVVDGVGRGRLVPVAADVFRIGAAMGTRPEENNDLVLSDSRALISRYHCSIIRRDTDWLLIDSSLNGTTINGVPLARGDQQLLEDGDELVLAGVTRMKFLVT